jgi:hypothetical protein
MAFSTQVLAVKCAWVLVTTSYRAKHLMSPLPENPTPLMLIRCWEPLGARVCPGPRRRGGLGWQVVKSYRPMPIEAG